MSWDKSKTIVFPALQWLLYDFSKGMNSEFKEFNFSACQETFVFHSLPTDAENKSGKWWLRVSGLLSSQPKGLSFKEPHFAAVDLYSPSWWIGMCWCVEGVVSHSQET